MMHWPLMIKISLTGIIKLLFYLNGLDVTVCEDCAVSQDNIISWLSNHKIKCKCGVSNRWLRDDKFPWMSTARE